MVVDLPAPLGPRNPVTTPGFTTKLSPSTAALSPYLLVRPSIWSGHQSQSCCVLSSVVADDPNATGGVTSGHLSPDRTFPAAYALRHRPISRRGLVGTAPERRNRLAGQPDAEPGGGELQQNLPGCLQDRDLGRAQLLELGQQTGVGVRPPPARLAQGDRVGPHLLARLAQEPLGPELVQGPEQPVQPRRGPGDPGQLVRLGPDAGGKRAVDGPVISLPPRDQRRVAELLVADHPQKRLRQVVVDVGVHAQQHVPERREVGGGAERDVPRPGWPPARHRGFQGIQVQLREGDIPPLDPLLVAGAAAVDVPGYRDRGAQVGGVEKLRRSPSACSGSSMTALRAISPALTPPSRPAPASPAQPLMTHPPVSLPAGDPA